MIKVIAFVGKAGAGKSTAAQYLVNRHKYVRLRFADPLKRMMACLGLAEEEIDGVLKTTPSEKLCGKTPRHAMQTLGTEWGRNCIGDKLWTNYMERRIALLAEGGVDKFVIDDVRFLNEANMLKRLSKSVAYDVNIVRVIGSESKVDNHQSETEQDSIEVDWSIKNIGSFNELYDHIDYWHTLEGI